jgi:hypothetical protein
LDRDLKRSGSPEVWRLLQGVRNRLWLASARTAVLKGTWIAAVILLAAGAWHLCVGGLPFWPAALLLPCSSIGAGALFGLLLGRPSLERAAREADRTFSGNGLMSSALELMRRSAVVRERAAGFVLASAGEAAAAWRVRLRQERGRGGLAGFGPPLVALAAATFLLLVPGARESARDPYERPSPVSAPPPALRAGMDRAVREGPIRSDDRAASGSRSPLLVEADQLPADLLDEPDLGVGTSPVASEGSARGDDPAPGDATPRRGARSPAPTGGTPVTGRPLELARKPGKLGREPARGPDLPATVERSSTVPLPARAVGTPARPELSPALRSFAAAYLSQLGDPR